MKVVLEMQCALQLDISVFTSANAIDISHEKLLNFFLVCMFCHLLIFACTATTCMYGHNDKLRKKEKNDD